MSTQINNHPHKGFTLVETLFYIGGVVLLLGVIVTTLINTYTWYQEVVAYPRVDTQTTLALSRIISDIRGGETINAGQSTFNVDTGTLSITGLDANGITKTSVYSLSNNRITLQTNAGTTQFLTPASLRITRLRFNQLNTALSSAVRAEIQAEYQTRSGTTTTTYSSLGILKNSYR